jgi:anti-sigma regulatory factor (Ser/Thr protein kinase)
MSDDEIRLALPAAPDFARLARLTAAGLATRLGFSYEEVEDLRIAVSEACTMLIGSEGRAGTLTLVYGLEPDRISIDASGSFDDDAPPSRETAAMSEQILKSVVDEFEYLPAKDTVRLRKRRVGP